MKRITFIIILVAVIVVIGVLALDYFKILPAPALNLSVLTTPTNIAISGPVILEAIQNQAQLETVSMVVANDRDITRVWGFQGACRETLTYLGYFQITAGVDLQNISVSDIKVENGTNPKLASITITLAPAVIQHVELDTVHSRVVHNEQSIISQLCGTQLPDMILEAQHDTQQMATDTAIEEDIIQMAQNRAGFELKKMLLNFGFSNATILFK
jgi:hypothetical protein